MTTSWAEAEATAICCCARASVVADVRHGYVTREAALRDYGMTEAELH